MELLQELLLTAGISLFLAFLLAKLVSIASPRASLERDSAMNPVSEPDLGLEPMKVVSSGGETVLIRETQEGSGDVQTIRQIRSPLIDEAIGVENEDPRGEEMVDMEEEDAVVVEGVERSVDMRAGDLDLIGTKEEECRSEINGGGLEVDSGKELPGKAEVRKVDGILAGDESRLIGEIKTVGLADDATVDIGEETEQIDLELMRREETLVEGLIDDVEVVRSADRETTENVGPIEIGVAEKSGLHETKGEMCNEDDDWEGIERSEIEKLFGVATSFTGSDGGNALSRLGSDVQMQLYGLHKVATEGPCYEPQPLALKLSARAKWHAWQKLGNMNPEEAMEQYITLLSDSIPGWKGEEHRDDSVQESGSDLPEVALSGSGTPLLSSLRHTQLNLETESNPVDHSREEKGNTTFVSQHSDQGLTADSFSSSISLYPQ